MKKILMLLMLMNFAWASDETYKVVYNLTTGDITTFKQKILKGITANKAYYESNLKELEVAVVIHGGAYKFFFKSLKGTQYESDKNFVKEFSDLQKRVRSLSETYDVKFSVCGVGLRSRKIPQSNIVDFVKVIPNAAIGLIDKQNEGFAYLNAGD